MPHTSMPVSGRCCAQIGRLPALAAAFVLGALLTLTTACSTPPAGNATPAPDGSTSSSGGETAALTTTNGSGAAAAPTALPDAVAQATARVAAMLPVFATMFGQPGTDPGMLLLVNDVAVDAGGNIYVSDSKGVTKFDNGGKFLSVIGQSVLKSAAGLAVGPGDVLYVTGDGALVQMFSSTGESKGTLGTEGKEPGTLAQPIDVAVDKDGNVYVADARNAHVEKYAPSGQHLLTIGERGDRNGQFTRPSAVAIDSAGRILVGLGDDFLVQRFNPDGSYLDSFGQSHADETMWRMGGIAVDAQDNYYLAMTNFHKIQAFSGGEKPKLLWEFGELGIGNSRFNSPLGMTIVGKELFVADQQNNQVQRFKLP